VTSRTERKEEASVSKRHQTSRRRAYGRRQHELHEREGRRHFQESPESAFDEPAATSSNDPFAFMDPRLPRLRYVLGD
jgi:hypothetical protein